MSNVKVQLTIENTFLTLGGLLAIYIGCRFIVAREIPIVSEDDRETHGLLRGKEAVIAGLAVIALGLALLAAAIGLIKLQA